MALHKKPKNEIIRTPAPDQNARVQNYGGVSLAPRQGGPTTLLGANLRDSVDDPAYAAVLAKGTAGRGDEIPADDVEFASLKSLNANDLPAGGELQRRTVSDVSYPPAHGAVRQQDPQKVFGDVAARPQRIGDRLSANGVRALEHNRAQPIRKPK